MVVEYTDSFDCISAFGKGKNFLMLRELDEPLKRFDGTKADYELEYRSLSVVCETERDQSWACVTSMEHTYYTKKELDKEILDGENLFEHFNLF